MSVHSLLPTETSNSTRLPIWPIVLFLLAHNATGLSAKQPEPTTSNARTERGFVFLDGRYIAPPYAIEVKDGVININGDKRRVTDFKMPDYYEMMRSDREKREQLHCELQLHRIGHVIVLFRNRQPMYLDEIDEGAQLIRVLARSTSSHNENYGIPKTLGCDVDTVTWDRLVSEFQPSTEFLKRASDHLEQLGQVSRTNTNCVAQNVWVSRIGFPLTVIAMVIVALAFGHLMSTKPYLGPDTAQMTDSPSARQIVFRSLLLVGALSVIDLIWTVVASGSGSMRELNPFGSQLIDGPLQLVAFKTATITPAIGLMYWLHRSAIAQAASWWSCLVLTLVTARWLTFSSMFL